MTRVLEEAGDDGLDVAIKRLRQLSKQLNELQQEKQEIDSRNVTPPTQMTCVDVEGMLNSLRGLLNADVASAAPILKELTGDIAIRQVREEGKRGATWIAKFSINAVPIIARIAAKTQCPTSRTWEYLHDRSWTMPQLVEVRIEKIPDYEKLAPEMRALYEKSDCVQAVASAYGIAFDRTKEILEFAKSGKRPKWKAGQRTGKGVHVDYERIAPVVVKLRDTERLPWGKIKTKLANDHGIHISITTICRAYNRFYQGKDD